MERYTMVKTEVQPNGEIVLYYVDENASTQDGPVVTTINQNQLQELENYTILEEVPTEDHIENIETTEIEIPEDSGQDLWLDNETKRLLIFYVDNKDSFQNVMTTKHLWSVACKTILNGKTMTSCESKLCQLKKKYGQLRINAKRNKIDPKRWPHYELCHQAFHDDSLVKMMLTENSSGNEKQMITRGDEKQMITLPVAKPHDGTVTIPVANAYDSTTAFKKMNKADEKVMHMLELYLQYKKESGRDYSWQKHVWDKIATEVGEDADYWHKRYLNYKQHYIRMLEKRDEFGSQNVTWPYIKLFEQIYADDEDFIQKYGQPIRVVENGAEPNERKILEWDETEKTVLVKYCFDSFDEFQDRTIPNSFLWNEVGRLLDKTPDSCKEKYQELKTAHLNLYIQGGYNIRSRKPIAILFDNIISKEIQNTLQPSAPNPDLNWPTEMTDEFVQFLFDNIEVFKDPVCYYVCWAAVAMKLEESVQNCKDQWSDLTTLYKSILNDKKEDPELQIFWRYIDIFDRIFDYGMDTKFLEGYDKPVQEEKKNTGNKKVTIKTEAEDIISDDDDFDEESSEKRLREASDTIQTKILEYYLKNKDKFATTPRKKQALWEVLAKQMGISAGQCAKRFNNLKKVYTMYIQKEINKPEKPILWPYYALCKKVFGYRAIKNKLKNGKLGSDDGDEWSTKEIKTLINHISKHLEIDSDTTDTKKWSSLAQEIGKAETSCRDKFLELRKSYRKIKTMISKNPECKVNWKYFKMFDEIYSKEQLGMEVGSSDENLLVPMELPTSENKGDNQDDDFQCIIVIQDGEDTSDLSNAQIIIKNNQLGMKPEENTIKIIKWTKNDKLKLLQIYYNYVKKNEGKFVNTRDMWNEIGSHFPNRSKFSCRKMIINLKTRYNKLKEAGDEAKINKSKHYRLLKKILSLKLKLYRPPNNYEDVNLKEMTTYKDVSMPGWIVEKALQYYLDHVEEFVNPKYDKKYAWIELSKAVSAPLLKIFRKINYLKQFYNSETNEVNGEKVEFGYILKEILEKEFICKIAMGTVPEPMNTDAEEPDITWSDDEIENLLLWYLENLDKFKNPKYAPSYLWLEASNVLHKTPLACSKKMMDIRSQYSAMVKDNPEGLNNWRFYGLCQKIYGTGKKNSENSE